MESELEKVVQMVYTTNNMVQKLDQPFKDMREVLIAVTQTLADMETNTPYDGGDTVKSRMSVANRRMLDLQRHDQEEMNKTDRDEQEKMLLQVPKKRWKAPFSNLKSIKLNCHY